MTTLFSSKRPGYLTNNAIAPDQRLVCNQGRCLLIQRYFCKRYDYEEKAILSKGYWNLNRKIWVTTRYQYVWQFLPNLASIISIKMRGYPQFSLWILIALARICFFRIVLNCAKIPLY